MTERRKFERLPVQLSVEVRSRGLGSVCQTADVSRHGLFLATPNPARERQLLILRIPLPDGGHPIDVMASVARSIPEELGQERSLKAGMGVNFFALTEENKDRWESFLASLRGLEPPKPQAQGNNRPTFLLQPKDKDRLRLFEAREFALGSMFLRTPVLRRVGESLRLVLLHPVSDEEFPLLAQVVRVSDGSGAEPKGMVLDFQKLDPVQRVAFHEFVEHGSGMPTEPPPSIVDAVRGLPDEPMGEHPALARPSTSRNPFEVGNGSLNGEQPTPTEPTPPLEDSPDEPVEPPASGAPRVEPVETEAPPPEMTAPERPAAERPTLERLLFDSPIPERVAPEKPLLERPMLERALPERPAPERFLPDEPMVEGAPSPATDLHGELRVALMARPDDVGMLFRLGSALAKEPRSATEAVALLTRLLAIEPQHALAHASLAWAYVQLGQHTDAKRHMSRLRRLGLPVDPALELVLAG